MIDPRLDEWVRKAEEDHLMAHSADPDCAPGGICFHCQQCIEKYLKGVLVQHGVAPPWTHNLIVLASLVVRQDAGFGPFSDELDVLNPYSVVARYPGFEPTGEHAREACQVMDELRTQIREFLSLDAE